MFEYIILMKKHVLNWKKMAKKQVLANLGLPRHKKYSKCNTCGILVSHGGNNLYNTMTLKKGKDHKILYAKYEAKSEEKDCPRSLL